MQNQYPMTRSKPISQRGLLGVIHLLVPCFLFSNPITYYHLLPPMFYDFTGKTTCESYTQLQLSRLFLDHETLKSKTFMYSNVMRWSCLKTSSPHPVKLRTCVTRLLKFNTKAPTCSFHFGGLGWFLSNRNTMGWNDKKVKLRSELVVELLDVAGVVVLGRRVKCRELQEIYELNKMSWLACFNVGDQGRTPSRDHLIWKSLGVSKVSCRQNSIAAKWNIFLSFGLKVPFGFPCFAHVCLESWFGLVFFSTAYVTLVVALLFGGLVLLLAFL